MPEHPLQAICNVSLLKRYHHILMAVLGFGRWRHVSSSYTDLKGIILSHLHNDYAGGLEDLPHEAPDLPVYISREHWKAFGEHPYFASMEGATPNHWPKELAPKVVDFEDKPDGPWKQPFPVTGDGRIIIVDTSGHVPGHIGLVIYGGNNDGNHWQTTYFLPGDATYLGIPWII